MVFWGINIRLTLMPRQNVSSCVYPSSLYGKVIRGGHGQQTFHQKRRDHMSRLCLGYVNCVSIYQHLSVLPRWILLGAVSKFRQFR